MVRIFDLDLYLGVIQNWLETVMVGKSLRNKSWKCHFWQNLEGSTANFTESEMILKKEKIPKEEVERMGMTNLFFAKNIEKLSSNSDSLPLTSFKIGKTPRIML